MEKKYFIDANSAAGYVSLHEKSLVGIANVYHLKSWTDQLIHETLRHIETVLKEKKLALEYIYNTFNPKLLSGLVIRELSTAFISGEEVIERAKVTHLNSIFCKATIQENKKKLEHLEQVKQVLYKKSYMHLNAALHIHHEWEKIYIDRMDVKLADEFKENLLHDLFDGVKETTKAPVILRRFFGASTPDGLTDFIPELTDGLTRYFIKGRPGTGKSTLMKNVLKKAHALGYDVDVYHCSLDPNSLDMIVIPELELCLFDATAPHEYEPTLKRDKLLDTYVAFIKKDTDERCASVLESIESKYKNQMTCARAALKEASSLRYDIEAIYQSAEIPSKKEAIFTQLVDVCF